MDCTLSAASQPAPSNAEKHPLDLEQRRGVADLLWTDGLPPRASAAAAVGEGKRTRSSSSI
eukprot:12871763-Heterocapsa_arctica.AAC.1